MQAQLKRSIAIAQAFMRDLGAPATSPSSSQDVHITSLLTTIAASGIPKLEHPRVPKAIATRLHEVTHTHFRESCMALQHRQSRPGLPSLYEVATDLRKTYIGVFQRKLEEVASRASIFPQEKQPYATDILLYAFDQSPSPSKRERAQLARLTGMTVEQVRVWFQNRRQRMKKRAPELQPRSSLQLNDVLARVAAFRKAADEDFEDNDSGYCSDSDRDRSATPSYPREQTSLTVASMTSRSYPAPYTRGELSSDFHCDPPVFLRTASSYPPVHPQVVDTSELTRLMSRLTLRQRRQTPRSSTGSATSTNIIDTAKSTKSRKPVATASNSAVSGGDAAGRKKAARKDGETGRKVAGRRAAAAAAAAASGSVPPSASSPLPLPSAAAATDVPAKPRKRAGPLRRKPAGTALTRQASTSSVASTSTSSDSSRSTSYSSDFSFASDSSFTSVESLPPAANMECFQPQQQPQFDPMAAFDFTQLFSSQPSDPLPQPVADFDLTQDLLAGLQSPMDNTTLPPPQSTDFLALLNDPTIQELLQNVQDMDVVAPQQTQESLTIDDMLDLGSVDTSAFLDLSATRLPAFDAMFGLNASSLQDPLWNLASYSMPITA